MKYSVLSYVLLAGASSLCAAPMPLWLTDLSGQLLEEPVYTLSVDDLLTSSIEKSYKVNAQQQTIESELALLKGANYYFLPSVTVTQHLKEKFDRPGHPSPHTEYVLDLNAAMKLWSNATGDRKDAAHYQLVAARETYNALVNGIYSTVSTNLVKIELSRNFLNRSEVYRNKLDDILSRMEKSSQTGILKQSDRLFADVALKKFEESIFNVQAQVEQYKSQINNITSANLYRDEYGVSREDINAASELTEQMFDIRWILQNNFEVRSKRAALLADRASAKGINENFTVELVSQQGIKEHRLTSSKNAQNQAEYGYTFDDDGESFIGFRVVYSGLDFSAHQSKQSEYRLYTRKMIELDEYMHQLYVDITAYRQQYQLIKQRLGNIDNQITLTNNVIQSLMNELTVDESSALDVFRNVTSLSDLEMNRLVVHNELVDLVMQVKSLNAVIPDHYVLD